MRKVIGIILVVIVIIGSIVFAADIRGGVNKWEFGIQKADDTTNYKTIKKVEDTCRAMIASYESDKLTYKQYKDSDNNEKQGWAEQAKMRANKTASSYNHYIIKNSFVWEDNIPSDIYKTLDIVE